MYKPAKPFESMDPNSTNPRNPHHYQKHDHHNPKPLNSRPTNDNILDAVVTGPIRHAHPEDLKPGKPPVDPALVAGKDTLDGVFAWIQDAAVEKLQRINLATEGINQPDLDEATKEVWKQEYNFAVEDYTNFVTELNNQDSAAFKGKPKTINWAILDPVMEEDKYVGVRIIVRWLGGTHSDSSGIAINHPPP